MNDDDVVVVYVFEVRSLRTSNSTYYILGIPTNFVLKYTKSPPPVFCIIRIDIYYQGTTSIFSLKKWNKVPHTSMVKRCTEQLGTK